MEDRFEVFATTVASINRSMQKIKTNVMNEFGLKGTHGMCLYMLGKEKAGLTSAQLSQLIKEDKAAISRAINELNEKGYIYIQEQDQDKRSYRCKILLTEQGKEVLRYIHQRVESALDFVGKDLSDEERRIFYSSFAIILHNLEKYLKEGKY